MAMIQGRWTKLRDGLWGARVPSLTVGSGDVVELVKADGTTSAVTIDRVLWRGEGHTLATCAKFGNQSPAVRNGNEFAANRRSRPSEGGTCDECGRPSATLRPCSDSSGITGRCCPRCAGMSRYERSFG